MLLQGNPQVGHRRTIDWNTFGIAVVISGTKLALIAKAEDVLQFLFFWKKAKHVEGPSCHLNMFGWGGPPPSSCAPDMVQVGLAQ